MSNGGDTYTFKLEGLPATGTDAEGDPVTYVYYVSEPQNVLDYQEAKYLSGSTQIMGASKVGDGGTIANDMIGVELPNAGGSGTYAFTIVGAVLAASAIFLLWRKRVQV